MEVPGVVVCSVGSMNLGFFTWGAGLGAPESPSPLARRAVFSSGEGKDPDSSYTGLNREAFITSSPLMVISGAMHCWSSLTPLHRLPCLALDASAQAYSALARANFFLADDQEIPWVRGRGKKVLWMKPF